MTKYKTKEEILQELNTYFESDPSSISELDWWIRFIEELRKQDIEAIVEMVEGMKRYDFIADQVYEDYNGEYVVFEDIINKLKEL